MMLKARPNHPATTKPPGQLSIPRNNRTSTPAGGWSLIELVVALSIVGILIGVLLPVLSASRSMAARSQCLSNQSSNAKALVFETVNNDGSFPTLGAEWRWVGGDRLKVMMNPRTRSATGLAAFDDEDLVCPSDNSGAAVPYDATGHGELASQLMSYGYSIGLTGLQRGLFDVPTPAATATFYDGYLSDDGTRGNGHSVVGFYDSMLDYARSTSELRHEGEMTVLFADWSADTLTAFEARHILEVRHGTAALGNGWSAWPEAAAARRSSPGS